MTFVSDSSPKGLALVEQGSYRRKVVEGLVIFALGAGTVWVAQHGRKQAKDAVGWIARQSGWVLSRVRSDIATARRVAREEFKRAREADPPPTPDHVVPSTRVPQAEENGRARAGD
jgi:hypothetical protein